MITVMQSIGELLIQITVWSSIGVLLLYMVNRFHPLKLASTSFLFVTGIVVLTIAIWIPWPSWLPSIEISSTAPPNDIHEYLHAEQHQKATASDQTVSAWWKDWQKYLPSLKQTTAATNSSIASTPWLDALVLFLVVGVAYCILKMILAFRRVQLYLAASHSIQDERLLAIRNELQHQLSLVNSVPILTTSIIDVPATCGFRMPVILLPGHWHTWNEAECRTVLAHELAHIKRHDYLMMLISQILVCLYWFHPLVRWVNHWLRSGQELATDALAVNVLGNRSVYLQSLCRLALRQDGASLPAPARLFLSPEVSLFRRIAMLREGTRKNVLMLNGLYTLMLALAISSGLGIAALRSEANTDVSKPNQPFSSNTAWQRYVDPDAPGYVVFRPATALSLASMQPHRAALNKLFKDEIDVLYAVFGMGVPLDAVECFAGPLHVELRKNGEKGTGSMNVRGVYFQLRTKEDAETWLRHCTLSLEKIDTPHGSYYKANGKPNDAMNGTYLLRPNDKTIVFAQSEKQLLGWLAKAKNPIQMPQWMSAMPEDTGILSLAVNMKSDLVKKMVIQASEDTAINPMFKPLYDHHGSMVCTLLNQDALAFQLNVACSNAESASSKKKQLDALVGMLKLVQVSGTTNSNPESEAAERQLLAEVMNNTSSSQVGNRLQFNTHCSLKLGDAIKNQVVEMTGKVKEKK